MTSFVRRVQRLKVIRIIDYETASETAMRLQWQAIEKCDHGFAQGRSIPFLISVFGPSLIIGENRGHLTGCPEELDLLALE